MSTQFISPVGRLVQGGMTLKPKLDDKGQPVLDKDTKQPVHECFMAIAIRKDDPGLPAFWQLFQQQAKLSFPHLLGTDGNIAHPKFAWKLQDGDGIDSNGQSVANKPGFAGHYVFKMATRFAPRCFHHGKYDPSQVITNPDEVIKKGYFIRVSGTIDGNGVEPSNRQAVPGLYVSPNLVELVAFGEEITSGPDASKVFGGAAITTPLPPGASAAPVLAAGGPTMPNATPAAPPGAVGPFMPAVGAPAALPAVGAPAALPSMPGAAVGGPLMPAAQPVYQMTASAQGATREQLLARGWTDEMLIQQGHMVRVG